MTDTPCDDRLNGRDVSSSSTLDHLSFVAVAVVVIAVDVLNDRIKLRDMNLELNIHFDSEPEKFELLKLDNNFVLILQHVRLKNWNWVTRPPSTAPKDKQIMFTHILQPSRLGRLTTSLSRVCIVMNEPI